MRILAGLFLLLLVACSAQQTANNSMMHDMNDTMMNHSDHGMVPAKTPNLPGPRGNLEVKASLVQYHANVQGFLARPADGKQYPGVVLIHEWWGLNDNIKAMAEQLASEGYVVLAVDLFNGTVATTPDQAMKLVGGFNQQEGLANMKDAVAYLRNEGVTSVGSVGWCFGGGQSLQLGLNDDMDATVMYYGQVVNDPTKLRALQQPLLGIFGDKDQSIPVASVKQFNQTLNQVGVENQIYIYPGVGHAFANPSGDNYNAPAAADAWKKTVAFLNANLK